MHKALLDSITNLAKTAGESWRQFFVVVFVLVLLAFVAWTYFHREDIKTPTTTVTANQTTSGSQSPIQNNQQGNNNYQLEKSTGTSK